VIERTPLSLVAICQDKGGAYVVAPVVKTSG